jgi:lipopolysaccharide transport system ATP-binding protein
MSSESQVERVKAEAPAEELSGGEASAPEVAIRTRGLNKAYAIYSHPRDRLKEFLWPGRRKFHRDVFAVRDVDLEIYRGETVGIVGRNGSGKSTLLNLICGVLEPSSGELSVQGHIAPILTLGAGFDAEFTGRENVMLNAAILGLSRSEILERMDSIIGFASIGEFFDRPVKLYSTGMYSRLAFAVAINVDPEILIVDEALAVGDEAFTRKCIARIEEMKKGGSTILFVSHSASMVVELCDRAVLLEGGERLLTSNPNTVIARYHRLLYSTPDELADTLEEIRALDLGVGADGRSPGQQPNLTAESDEAPLELEDYGSFDGNLQPESTSEYGRKGARIVAPRILDPYDRQVNVLRSGKEYTYAYEVCFDETAYFVRFGMMIKLPTGIELGGQASHSSRERIERVECGQVAEVRFRFRALLTPGTYFLNAGVLALCDGEEDYLQRILDAVAFRIDPTEQNEVTGRVDFAPPTRASVVLAPAEEGRASAEG